MATREIKTTIALDGEQKFKQALSAATREMRVMESELKAVSAAYDTNGNSAEYFAAKQSNLRDQISQQRQIIEALERAVEDAAQAYGEGSSQVDGYAIRLNNARTRMSRLEQQIEETDREIEELGRDSVRAGRQLEDGIGEGAESAERSVRDLVNTMKEDISSIRTSTAFTAVSGLWDMASGAFSSVSGFVESTQEYRRQLSFLEQNAATKGFDFTALKDQLIEVQALTGDSSSAIEGLSNLLQTDVDERQMEKAINNLAGAVISFPETMKFESLADGLQETIATGAATGSFAELLERLGVNVDEFNTALEESDSAAGDLDIALAYLAANGMENVYKQWQKNNGSMSEAMQTQAALEMELAEFGGTLEKYITTPVKELLVDAMQWVNETVSAMEEKGVSAGLAQGARAIDEAVETPREALIRQEKEGTAPDNIFKNFVEGWSNLFTNDDQLSDADDAGEKAGKQYGKSFNKAVDDYMRNEHVKIPSPLQEVSPGQKLIDGIGMGEEWKRQLDQIATAAETAAPTVQAAGEAVGTALSTGFEESAGEVEDAAEDAGETAGNAFEGAASQFTTLSRMIGVQYGRAFGDGIVSQYGYVASASKRLASAASSAFGGARSTVASGAAAAASGNVTAVLNIDGRTFARVTAPYMATALSHD